MPGGLVSGSLVHNTRPGDTLLLGQAQGEMTVSAGRDRDLLCIAGGTGLAPLKAIIEGVLRAGGPLLPRKLHLGVRAPPPQTPYQPPRALVLALVLSEPQ